MIFYYINEINRIGLEVTQFDYGYYKVGYDLNNFGDVDHWSNIARIPHRFGVTSDGGGINVYIRSNGTPGMTSYFLDNPNGTNYGHIYIGNYRR